MTDRRFRDVSRDFSVALVLHDFCRGWIIEKLAYRLRDELRSLGTNVEVSPQPSAAAVINHFMIFHYVEALARKVNTVAVTHVDDALKIDMLRNQLNSNVRAAICMSSMTVQQLISAKLPDDRLTYIVPAHDDEIIPRRLIIGITSNNPNDGRKRDWLLTRLAEELRLDDFEFRIFGFGWNDVRISLEKAGANVIVKEPSGDYRGDYEGIKASVPYFDYYFYPGLDEGSLGTFDALAAGVKTIITKQGFHLDIPNGITHGFWDYDELKTIFEDIIRDRHGRIDMARRLTWTRYAQKHLDVWNALIERDELPSGETLNSDLGSPPASPPKQYPVKGYLGLLSNPYRRDMTLRYWLPQPYANYVAARRKLGRVIREWRGLER